MLTLRYLCSVFIHRRREIFRHITVVFYYEKNDNAIKLPKFQLKDTVLRAIITLYRTVVRYNVINIYIYVCVWVNILY